MTNLLKCSSIIRVAVVIIVAFMVSQANIYADPSSSSSSPTLATGVGIVQAGAKVTIYNNYAIGSVWVTMTVSDYSAGLDSILTYTKSSSDTPVNITIPDNNSVAGVFTVDRVADGGSIELECLGTGGYCLYKIDPTFRP